MGSWFKCENFTRISDLKYIRVLGGALLLADDVVELRVEISGFFLNEWYFPFRLRSLQQARCCMSTAEYQNPAEKLGI